MKIIERLKGSSFYKTRIVIEKVIDSTLGLFLFQYKRKDNLFNWYYSCLKYQHIENPESSPKYTYYEFGVASGGSMRIYLLALKKFCRDYSIDINKFHVYGFDSFQGLPKPQDADRREDWKEGLMHHPKSQVEGVIKETGFPRENVHLVEGFYENSLTDDLRNKLRKNPPAIINMDADYYSSTITVFNWIGDILPSGCYFRFDDMWAFYGHPEKGVIKAINEFNDSAKFGWLTPFPCFGLASYCYVFVRRKFEYV